jgi:hypothetical protein
VTALWIPAVEVESGAEALQRLVVEGQLAAGADVRRARSLLERVLRARGPSGPAQKAALSFFGAQVLRLRLSAPGAQPIEVDIPRAGGARANGAQGRRPTTGAKRDLDLSNLYSPEGFMGTPTTT